MGNAERGDRKQQNGRSVEGWEEGDVPSKTPAAPREGEVRGYTAVPMPEGPLGPLGRATVD